MNIILALNVYSPHYTLLLWWHCILPLTVWQCCVLMCISRISFYMISFCMIFCFNATWKCTHSSYLRDNFTLTQFRVDNRNWREIGVISQLEKGKQIVDICCNVKFIHVSVHTISDNAARIIEIANSGTKMFV